MVHIKDENQFQCGGMREGGTERGRRGGGGKKEGAGGKAVVEHILIGQYLSRSMNLEILGT